MCPENEGDLHVNVGNSRDRRRSVAEEPDLTGGKECKRPTTRCVGRSGTSCCERVFGRLNIGGIYRIKGSEGNMKQP